MSLIVGAFETVRGQMGISLSRGQMGMAQEFLDGAQIGAGIEEVRCIAVTQFVRRQVRIQAGYSQVLFEMQLQVAR